MTDKLPRYEIRIQGYLDERYYRWFSGLEMERLPNGETRLCGDLDPASLHGVLNRIRDLNLPLILVQQITPPEGEG